MTEKWITTTMAARIIGYQPERIRELLRDGKINGQKFGTTWQVDQSSLLSYIAGMKEIGKKRGPKNQN